jgi:hypothetical protein
LIYSNFYLYYYMIMILLNTFQVLLLFRPWTGKAHLDLDPESTVAWERTCFLALETIISLILITEVALKLSWLRRDFFYGSDRCTNILDFFLALACGIMLIMIAAGEWYGTLEKRLDTTSRDSEALVTLSLAVVLRVLMRIVRLVPAAKHWLRIRQLSAPDSQVRFRSFLTDEETARNTTQDRGNAGGWDEGWLDASTTSTSSWGGGGDTAVNRMSNLMGVEMARSEGSSSGGGRESAEEPGAPHPPDQEDGEAEW